MCNILYARIIHRNILYGSHSDMCLKGKWPRLVFPRWTNISPSLYSHCPHPPPLSFNRRKCSVFTLHCPYTQIYTALFIFHDLENIFCLVGSQGFSNQTGFTEFPHTPGTPTLGEYSTPGPPPPLPYQSEQVSPRSTSTLQHMNEKTSPNVARGHRNEDEARLCPFSLMVESLGWTEHGPRALLHNLASPSDWGICYASERPPV